MLKRIVPPAKLHKLASKVHKHAPKARLTGEAIAAFFVSLETHFLVFSMILAVWFVLDVFELFTEKRIR